MRRKNSRNVEVCIPQLATNLEKNTVTVTKQNAEVIHSIRKLLHKTNTYLLIFGFCLTGLFFIDYSGLGQLPHRSSEEPLLVLHVVRARCPSCHSVISVKALKEDA